jgi:hypothetical protein
VLKTNGLFTGKLYLAGTTKTLAGKFDTSGQTAEPLGTIAGAGGNVTLQLNILPQNGPRQITGSVQGTGWISTNLNLYAATTNTSNSTHYTLLLPQDTNDADSTPPDYGYALITNTGSMINVGGSLSDGTAFSSSEPVNDQNEFPVYASLYGNTGLLLGSLSLDASTNTPSGNLFWIKPFQRTGRYTSAFNTVLAVEGSPWTNSEFLLTNLFPNGATLTFSNGGLATNLVYDVQLTAANKLKFISGSTNFASGSINPANGLMTLAFTNTSGSKVTAAGALLQNIGQGGGFFLGATNAGAISLQPAAAP